MTGLTINTNKGTIEMTKAYEKMASRFGTQEYKDLQQVKKDYPDFRVVVKKTKSGDRMKGLDYTYMEKYIIDHLVDCEYTDVYEDEDGNECEEVVKTNTLEIFYSLCGKNSEGKTDASLTRVSYGEIKKWFLKQYPEVVSKRRTQAMLSSTKVIRINSKAS